MSDTPGNNKTTFNDVYGKTGQEHAHTDRKLIEAFLKGESDFHDNDKFMEHANELFDLQLMTMLGSRARGIAAKLFVSGYQDFDAAVLATIGSVFDTPLAVRRESKPFESGWYIVTWKTEVGNIDVEIATVGPDHEGRYDREVTVRWPNTLFKDTVLTHAETLKKGRRGLVAVYNAARVLKEFFNVDH